MWEWRINVTILFNILQLKKHILVPFFIATEIILKWQILRKSGIADP